MPSPALSEFSSESDPLWACQCNQPKTALRFSAHLFSRFRMDRERTLYGLVSSCKKIMFRGFLGFVCLTRDSSVWLAEVSTLLVLLSAPPFHHCGGAQGCGDFWRFAPSRCMLETSITTRELRGLELAQCVEPTGLLNGESRHE